MDLEYSFYRTTFRLDRKSGKTHRQDVRCSLEERLASFRFDNQRERATDPSISLQSGEVYIERIDRSGGRRSAADGKISMGDKVLNAARQNIGFIVDVWSFFWKATSITCEADIPVFLASFPPRSIMLAAYLTKLANRSKLFIADFRDPWRFDEKSFTSNRLNKPDRWLLRSILRKADLVLAVSQSNLASLSAAVDLDIRNKCLVVPNSVDPHFSMGLPAQAILRAEK